MYFKKNIYIAYSFITMNYRTEEMANKLRKAFKNREVKKTYLVITKGIPSIKEGKYFISLISALLSFQRILVVLEHLKILCFDRHY